MQILEGWKRKQFTFTHQHKHKYTRERKTSSRSCNFKLVQIEIFILESAYKWSQFRGNAGYCFSLIDILTQMPGMLFS